ncbi:glycosyltransferase family 2 protein [Cloacibacterium sp.]|uniref:glycosyltransferase family 2 protein n=1 Tax=Cloacibacterium sp. TaxID=1913682 RepID=UPI0039E5E998
MPLISVIVPCYNQAQYLDECLQSVLDQTYQDWECIIVNDGSPDHTEEIAKKWVGKDPRFRYIYKENGGLSSARNAGIKISKGEWILPLDADDKIGNQYLELAEKEFAKNPTVIYCNAEFFGIENKPWLLPNYTHQQILTGNIIFCSGFLKKENWVKVLGYDENLKYGREDWDFWLSILNENSLVIKLDYVGFFYRRKENSMDDKINQNSKLLNEAENYIYRKHLSKYLDCNENAIKNYSILKNKSLKYDEIILKTQKNKLSKLLFKIIERL